MLDKFLFSLSLDYFVACLLPKASAELQQNIAMSARQEISNILKGIDNYYKADASKERALLSEARLISIMQQRSVHPTAAKYIAFMLKIFNEECEPTTINNFFSEQIDRILVLSNTNSNPNIYSAIQKLHEHHIFTHSSTDNQWASENLRKDASSWATKLRNPLLFDGIEDAIDNIIYDTLDYFPLLSFIGSVNCICDKQEVTAIIDNITKNTLPPTAGHSGLIEKIATGLKLDDTLD